MLLFRRNELVNVNERKQKEALQEFYENETLKQNNQNRIKSLKTFSRVINPLFCIGFVIVFWAVGMQHYFQKLYFGVIPWFYPIQYITTKESCVLLFVYVVRRICDES